jgi:hypothetical protein
MFLVNCAICNYLYKDKFAAELKNQFTVSQRSWLSGSYYFTLTLYIKNDLAVERLGKNKNAFIDDSGWEFYNDQSQHTLRHNVTFITMSC